ncbi:MAG: SPFH domain-containing protein [Patescibacteria group bacterium]
MSVDTRRTVTLITTILWFVMSVVYTVTLYFVAGPKPEYDNRGSFWFMLIVGLFIVYALMFPRNWAYVPNKYRGVVFRLGQAVQTLHGEGVIHVFWPIESVRRVATFDLKRTRVFVIPVAGDTPQDIRVKVLRIIRFSNPILTLQSVPDKDPEIEADDIIEAHVRQAFQNHTLNDVIQPGATANIDASIAATISGDETLAAWGVTVLRVKLLDIKYPKPVTDAASDILRARGHAAAEEIEAQGRREAINKIGETMYTKLEWFQALKESKITTLIGGGLKDLFFDVQEFLGGKGK